jgi:diacylglycerol kinase family enzyme
VAIFKRVFSGTHTTHPKVETTTAADIAIDAAPAQRLMADGELLGETPLRLHILPGALTILA